MFSTFYLIEQNCNASNRNASNQNSEIGSIVSLKQFLGLFGFNEYVFGSSYLHNTN